MSRHVGLVLGVTEIKEKYEGGSRPRSLIPVHRRIASRRTKRQMQTERGFHNVEMGERGEDDEGFFLEKNKICRPIRPLEYLYSN